MSRAVLQETLTRLLMEKGMLTKGELLEMLKVVSQEMKREKIQEDNT